MEFNFWYDGVCHWILKGSWCDKWRLRYGAATIQAGRVWMEDCQAIAQWVDSMWLGLLVFDSISLCYIANFKRCDSVLLSFHPKSCYCHPSNACDQWEALHWFARPLCIWCFHLDIFGSCQKNSEPVLQYDRLVWSLLYCYRYVVLYC